MRRQTGRVALVASILLLAGAALWWWPEAPTTHAAPALTGDAPAAEPTDDASWSDAPLPPSVAAPTPRAELPADDAPLAGILRPLADRADAGDRKAACRLAMELLRCEQLKGYVSTTMASPPTSSDSDTGAPTAGMSEWEREMSRWSTHWLEQCNAVPDTLRGQGGRYLAQAARAGEPEAMVRYADGQHWPPSGRGAFAGPDFDRWRRDAPGMMQRAVESGYPAAVFALMIAYGDDIGLHAALVPNDPEQALVLSLLHSRLYGANEMRHYQNAVDAATQLRARERAGQMHQRYFNGRQFRGFPYPTAAFVPPQGGETTHSFCREP